MNIPETAVPLDFFNLREIPLFYLYYQLPRGSNGKTAWTLVQIFVVQIQRGSQKKKQGVAVTSKMVIDCLFFCVGMASLCYHTGGGDAV